MAVHNATCTSIADLITQLDTYLATRGFTPEHLDITTTAGTGGEWAMKKGNIRFATSWDSENAGSMMAIYQYSDQDYVIGDRPWGQDHDSGNGFAATTPDDDIDNERHVNLTTTPEEFWVLDNEVGNNYVQIIVETATGDYAHFGFGQLDKRGDWVGGEYCYGQKNNNSTITSGIISLDNVSFLIDGHLNDTGESGGVGNNSELWAATIHCESLPNQAANGMWAVSVGGTAGSPHTDMGLDRQSNDGSSSDTARAMFFGGLRAGPWAEGFYRGGGKDLSGEMRMWPISCSYYDSTTGHTYGPMGFMPNVFGCVIRDKVVAGTIFTDEAGDQYYIFPAFRPYVSPATGSSGNLGIAYKVDVYIDPGLPASVNAPSGRWSAFNSDDYTTSGSEITVLNDLSANSNDFTPHSGKTGPDTKVISGRTWMEFPAASGRLMSVTNTDTDPDGGDFTVIVVFRALNAVFQAFTGKIGSGNPNYGLFCGVSNTRSLYYQHRDTGLTNTDVVEHDDAGTDYTDGTSRIACAVFDQTANTLNLFGEDDVTPVATDASTQSGTITPSNDLFLGDWGTSFNRAFEGEIAEVLYYPKALSLSERADIYGYLEPKWGI